MQTVRQLEAQLSPKRPVLGETAGQTVRIQRRGTPIGGHGERILGGFSGGAKWGTDVHVRVINTDFMEFNPSMTSDSEGNLYAVWQNRGQPGVPEDYLQVYKSTNSGQTWDGFGWLGETGADLKEPSIAVGEGNADTLLIAYIVDNGDTISYPEVAISPLNAFNWTSRHSVPIWDWWDGYEKPVIWTDSYDWNAWYAYLTCDGIYTYPNNVNGCFWRSTDYGATWGNAQAVFGAVGLDKFIDHDGTYGTPGDKIYVANYNVTDSTLYCVISYDFGVSFDDTVAIFTLPEIPSRDVDPDIEAAVNYDHVMLCCTKSWSADDDIGQTYSTNGGLTWTHMWSLEGRTENWEFAADLTADEGGSSWHVAYTSNHHVFYSCRPQDLSGFWQLEPTIIDDYQWASLDYSKKGIASEGGSNFVGIAWADYRDLGPDDYDIYFDYGTCDRTSPEAIDDLTIALENGAKSSSGDMRLLWTETYDDVGVMRYEVYRSISPHSLGSFLSETTDTTYVDVGAAGDVNTNYFYIVKAVDTSGNKSEDSNRVGEFDQILISLP
jgi:hypothetical protein